MMAIDSALSTTFGRPALLSAFGALLVALLTFFAPVTNAPSDPLLSLVVSQSLIEHRTLSLEPYYAEEPELFDLYAHQTIRQGGRLHYTYPVAPALFALPAVWLAGQAGLDMRDIPLNNSVQQALAAVVCALIVLVMGQTALLLLPLREALLITAITFGGSTLISTLGTAYWNLGPMVLFVSAGLLLIVRHETAPDNPARRVNGWLMGGLLVAAWLSRPSAALFILAIFAWLWLHDRPMLWRTAGTALAGLLLFTLFSRLVYGAWLPYYYTASTWFYTLEIGRPLYGLTFGPGQGLFVFSPFLLVVVAGSARFAPRLWHRPLFLICLLWIGAHLLTVSTTRQWWGGFSYGPRLLTDVLPAFFLLTLTGWRTVRTRLTPRARTVWAVSYLLTGLVALAIHSGQGLFGVKSHLWSAYPHIDHYPAYLFDWQNPPFSMTLERFHARREAHYARLYAEGAWPLRPWQAGETVVPSLNDSEQAVFIGWNRLPDQTTGTETETVKLLFTLDGVAQAQAYQLVLEAVSFGSQRVIVSVNGHEAGMATFSGPSTGPAQERLFVIAAEWLEPDGLNVIAFGLPDANRPNPEQLRQLSRYAIYHRLGLRNVRVTLDVAAAGGLFSADFP